MVRECTKIEKPDHLDCESFLKSVESQKPVDVAFCQQTKRGRMLVKCRGSNLTAVVPTDGGEWGFFVSIRATTVV